MGNIKTFKELIAWQKAYKLCLSIYKMVKPFPRNEQFGLIQQIKRSAVSIPSNIAEGFSRRNIKEYIQFLYISYSSLAELETQVMLANDLQFIDRSIYSNTFDSLKEVQRILWKLIKSLELKAASR